MTETVSVKAQLSIFVPTSYTLRGTFLAAVKAGDVIEPNSLEQRWSTLEAWTLGFRGLALTLFLWTCVQEGNIGTSMETKKNPR